MEDPRLMLCKMKFLSAELVDQEQPGSGEFVEKLIVHLDAQEGRPDDMVSIELSREDAFDLMSELTRELGY